MLYRVRCWPSRTLNVIAYPSSVFEAPAINLQPQRRISQVPTVQNCRFHAYRQFSSTVPAEQLPGHEVQDTDNKTEAPSHRPIPPLASLLNTPNPLHSNLSSFLEHARRVQLKPSTQVFFGTRYEYLAQQTLARHGFELLRTGKAGDRGVDLAGWWHLPDVSQTKRAEPTQRVRVLVQCKRLKGKRSLTPAAVRELEGAFLGAPTGWRSDEVLGIMVSTRPATKGVVTALSASRKGLVWICLEEHASHPETIGEVEADAADDVARAPATSEDVGADATDADEATKRHEVHGTVVQMLYNQAARRLGLEGLDVIRRHNVEQPDPSRHVEITLVYRGRPVQEFGETTLSEHEKLQG